jgi:preprotein translocase subunit SecA
MQNLRQGIGLHAYGQRDPLVMYKMEGSQQFNTLLENIRHDIVRTVYHVVPVERATVGQASKRGVGGGAKPNGQVVTVGAGNPTTVMSQAVAPQRVAASGIPKVGRNDPCPCGNGKKYKRCHGANG